MQRNAHILIVLQEPGQERNAIRHGLKLAEIFRAEPAIALFESKYDKKSLAKAESQIRKLRNEDNLPCKTYLTIANSEELNNHIQQLVVFYLVFQFNRKRNGYRKLLRLLRSAKVPSIIVQRETKTGDCYKKIFIPVDNRKETKEKMIWSSYFGRFHNARLFLLAARESSRELNQKIDATLLFAKNMFRQFSFLYEITTGQSRSAGIENEAFVLACKAPSGLVVVLTNKQQSFIDLFFSPSELKAIFNRQKLPVMCINPLKDYYIPCE